MVLGVAILVVAGGECYGDRVTAERLQVGTRTIPMHAPRTVLVPFTNDMMKPGRPVQFTLFGLITEQTWLVF